MTPRYIPAAVALSVLALSAAACSTDAGPTTTPSVSVDWRTDAKPVPLGTSVTTGHLTLTALRRTSGPTVDLYEKHPRLHFEVAISSKGGPGFSEGLGEAMLHCDGDQADLSGKAYTSSTYFPRQGIQGGTSKTFTVDLGYPTTGSGADHTLKLRDCHTVTLDFMELKLVNPYSTVPAGGVRMGVGASWTVPTDVLEQAVKIGIHPEDNS
ncbi:hypothetical protein [Kitasatospora sp. MAP5-34]|uniref:hypothetical protein n=1 Tax=Kitasatospora sp. MAP5-34 TaxID=3035102 RepID=UPI0024735E45|nr:hypothetical protein [Kitasatospora sp. MAP5-34]MDH6580524.1 hypothetical protein [Kitasatospora sp. MAP5-34]